MKLKIVHIVFDDKFIDGAISLFDADNRVDNTYVIIGEPTVCKYIHSSNIVYVSRNDAIKYINSYDVIIFHSLPSFPIDLISAIKEDILVVWFAWGYDLYENPYRIIPLRLYAPETIKQNWCELFYNKIHLRNILKRIVVRFHLHKALGRINYFSGVFPYEFYMIKTLYPEFKANSLDFYYGAKNFFIPEIPQTDINLEKHNILIGNSADMTGNHLDVLKRISNYFDSKEESLIIPLSYGGSLKYIKKVESYAESIAPGRVITLKKYLPLNEYLGLISNCKSAVFAHERQQASDNIFLQLIYGARVFMSENSAAYVYLKGIGLKVYSLQKDIYLIMTPMGLQDIMENRKILSSLYSSSTLIKRVKDINTVFLESANR